VTTEHPRIVLDPKLMSLAGAVPQIDGLPVAPKKGGPYKGKAGSDLELRH
jgi:hypothetical protein